GGGAGDGDAHARGGVRAAGTGRRVHRPGRRGAGRRRQVVLGDLAKTGAVVGEDLLVRRGPADAPRPRGRGRAGARRLRPRGGEPLVVVVGEALRVARDRVADRGGVARVVVAVTDAGDVGPVGRLLLDLARGEPAGGAVVGGEDP